MDLSRYGAVHGRWVHGCSLPPQVEGSVRAYISLSVNGIAWSPQYSSRGRGAVVVRAKWWGQTSGGIKFKPPVLGVPHTNGVGSDVRFPVRCSSTKLQHYLSDSRQLVLDVITVNDGIQRTIGRVRLGFLRPIPCTGPLIQAGDFDIQDPTTTTIGTLTASLNIEPILRGQKLDASQPQPMPSASQTVQPHSAGVIVPSVHALLDGQNSTASFVANEMLAQASLVQEQRKTRADIDSSAPGELSEKSKMTRGINSMKMCRNLRPAHTIIENKELDGQLAAIFRQAERLQARIAVAHAHEINDGGVSVTPFARQSLAGTECTAAPRQSQDGADPWQLAPPFRSDIATIRNVRSLRLFVGKLTCTSFNGRGTSLCSNGHDFVYLECQLPSWCVPTEVTVAGRRLSPVVVEFGGSAHVSVGERAERTAQWWSVAKLVFTVRTLGTTAARDQLGPKHTVSGIACVHVHRVFVLNLWVLVRRQHILCSKHHCLTRVVCEPCLHSQQLLPL